MITERCHPTGKAEAQRGSRKSPGKKWASERPGSLSREAAEKQYMNNQSFQRKRELRAEKWVIFLAPAPRRGLSM